MKQRILIFGVRWYAGQYAAAVFSAQDSFEVYGTARSHSAIEGLPSHLRQNIFLNVDAENVDHPYQSSFCCTARRDDQLHWGRG